MTAVWEPEEEKWAVTLFLKNPRELHSLRSWGKEFHKAAQLQEKLCFRYSVLGLGNTSLFIEFLTPQLVLNLQNILWRYTGVRLCKDLKTMMALWISHPSASRRGEGLSLLYCFYFFQFSFGVQSRSINLMMYSYFDMWKRVALFPTSLGCVTLLGKTTYFKLYFTGELHLRSSVVNDCVKYFCACEKMSSEKNSYHG